MSKKTEKKKEKKKERKVILSNTTRMKITHKIK